MSVPIQAFHAIVHGVVQGVAFRYYTRRQATVLGLVGFVRNLQDGTVELAAEGASLALEELEQWLHHGPPAARVDRLEIHRRAPTGEYREFQIAH